MLSRTASYEWWQPSQLLALRCSFDSKLILTYYADQKPGASPVYEVYEIPPSNVEPSYWVNFIDDLKHKDPLEIFQEVKRVTIARSTASSS